MSANIRRSIRVHSNCKQIDDGDTTLENEGLETSGQFTHIWRRVMSVECLVMVVNSARSDLIKEQVEV